MQTLLVAQKPLSDPILKDLVQNPLGVIATPMQASFLKVLHATL